MFDSKQSSLTYCKTPGTKAQPLDPMAVTPETLLLQDVWTRRSSGSCYLAQIPLKYWQILEQVIYCRVLFREKPDKGERQCGARGNAGKPHLYLIHHGGICRVHGMMRPSHLEAEVNSCIHHPLAAGCLCEASITSQASGRKVAQTGAATLKVAEGCGPAL